VLFFGDLLTARVATVGINPSRREYTDHTGQELDGPRRRFETLGSLGAPDRASLSPEQCARAVATMRAYYRPGGPAYSWFAPLARVTRGLGFAYATGEVAHLDLVQEATDPTWSAFTTRDPVEAAALRVADAPFLLWQIETFPLKALLCNGRTVFDGVCGLIGAKSVVTDRVARVTWQIAAASVRGRPIAVVGWNIPLARPTGLTADDQCAMGQLFRRRLDDLDLSP
jgi:hypothetical protein